MVEATSRHGLPYPAPLDSVRPQSRDLRDLAIATDAAITENRLSAATVQGMIDESSTSWNRGDLGSTHLDEVITPGVYGQVWSSVASPDLGYPEENVGELTVSSPQSSFIYQTYTVVTTGSIWTRRLYIDTWSTWQEVGAPDDSIPALSNTDLNTVLGQGRYVQLFDAGATGELNYPPIGSANKAGYLEVLVSSGVVAHVYLAPRAGEMWSRNYYNGNWRPWQQIGGSNSGGGGSGDGIPRTDMELTGRWTSNNAGDAFLQRMGEYEAVEVREIGRSVHDRPILAAVIGDPTNPAVLVNSGAHGTEVGTPEAAWLWVRELAQAKSLMLMDLCVLVVPMQNPDNRFNARGNRNAVDLNRDWLDRSQPETQAVASLLDEYNVVAALDVHNFGYAREISLFGATLGAPEVNALSHDLHEAVFAAVEVDGQMARTYGPGGPPETLVQGVAAVENIATLLVEIPCGGYGDWTFDHYQPAPSWQAHVGIVACDAFAKHVWENLPAFEALKSGG